MDILLSIMLKVWHFFINSGFPVVFQGETYYISLMSILLFTTITAIAFKVLFSLFE